MTTKTLKNTLGLALLLCLATSTTQAADKPTGNAFKAPAAKTAPNSFRAAPRPTGQRGFSQRPGSGTTADTSCNGVAACNDMIATCISLGGNVTPTSYDPGTGAPNGATCYSPGN